ncbi:MAG: TIGR04255 family protein [Pirellulales bacterium]
MDRDPLPDYENPPVVETVLGVQFDRLPGFRNAHLGAFWKSFDATEWPVVQDVPLLPPEFERFGTSGRWAKGVQLQLTQDPACRLQIKNRAGDRMIQLQNNRLHFNWLGGAGGRYPRYEKVRDEFVGIVRKFIDFIEHADVGALRLNQWEVTYVNAIPQGSVWQTPGDWSFFKLLAGLPTIEDLVQGESCGGEWHFAIPGRKGRLHVQWHHGVKATTGESEGEIVQLTFTARGPIEAGDDPLQAITDGLSLGRRTIVSSFKELMSDAANHYWGLRDHASN